MSKQRKNIGDYKMYLTKRCEHCRLVNIDDSQPIDIQHDEAPGTPALIVRELTRDGCITKLPELIETIKQLKAPRSLRDAIVEFLLTLGMLCADDHCMSFAKMRVDYKCGHVYTLIIDQYLSTFASDVVEWDVSHTMTRRTIDINTRTEM